MMEYVAENSYQLANLKPDTRAPEKPLTGPFAKEGIAQEEKAFAGATKHVMEFKGSGKEYFKIWIVNLVLSILTLGVYSAWATVRTKKYFYGNMFLDNSSFDYHATPKQILIGRMIAIGIFIAVSLLSNLNPIVPIVAFLVIFLLAPIIIQRSMRFNHSVTSFRNVRFAFDGKASSAYIPYFLLPIVVVFSGYVLYPFVHHAANNYTVNNSRYGNLKFRARLKSSHYFISYLKIIGILFVLAIAMVLLGIGMMKMLPEESYFRTNILSIFTQGDFANILIMLVYITVVMFSQSFIEAVIRKHYFSNTYIGGIANLGSTMKVKSLFWINMKNTVLLMLTLGLYYPWAKINIARFHAENTMVYLSDDVGEVISEQQKTSSLGDELGDAFDIDVVGGF